MNEDGGRYELPPSCASLVKQSVLAHRIPIGGWRFPILLAGKYSAHARPPPFVIMLHQENFQPEPPSARAVRQFVTKTLAEVPQLDDIVLTASELASNVIRHAHTPFTVQLELHENMVRLAVSDESPYVPAVEDADESHRGLRLVDAASDKWGIDGNRNGKTIWAEFETGKDPQ